MALLADMDSPLPYQGTTLRIPKRTRRASARESSTAHVSEERRREGAVIGISCQAGRCGAQPLHYVCFRKEDERKGALLAATTIRGRGEEGDGLETGAHATSGCITRLHAVQGVRIFSARN
jgi:hypothetical protein